MIGALAVPCITPRVPGAVLFLSLVMDLEIASSCLVCWIPLALPLGIIDSKPGPLLTVSLPVDLVLAALLGPALLPIPTSFGA